MCKLLLVSAMLLCQQLFSQSIIYVNHAATGANNGGSWADAYADLQDALEAAQAGDEIWVAQGWYYPSKGLGNDTTVTTRDMCFSMVDSVGIYGGFDGTETLRKQRDFRNNKTTLSGDVGVVGDKTDNAFHVIHNDDYHNRVWNVLSEKSVLDGFTIRDGYSLNGDLFSDEVYGAGVFNYGTSEAVFINLVVKLNSAYRGGGVANEGNTRHLTFVNCKIFNNYAKHYGYGVFSTGGAGWHGEIFTNCFIGLNSGDVNYHDDFSADFSAQNTVYIEGCTFSDAGKGRAISTYGGSIIQVVNSVILDSVFGTTIQHLSFQNSLVKYSGGSSNWNYNYTDMGGNIDTNAYLVGNGNFALESISPAIDTGLLDSIPMDKYDLDEDGITNEPIPYDLDGNIRVADGAVDMGAYEYIPAWTDTLFQTVCEGDSSLFDGHYMKDEGVYKQSYAPDSALYFSMDIDTPNVGVEVWFGGILEAKADSVKYQWIDCNDTTNKLIATQKVFYPTKPGDYAVIITTQNGCVDTSACYNVTAIGLAEQSLKDEFYLYPNPVKDVLKIGFGEGQKVLNISIKNVSGQSLLTTQVQLQGQSELEVDVEVLPAGIYFLEVNGRVKRFVKQN